VTDGRRDSKHPFWSPDGRRIYYVTQAKDKDSLWSVGAAGGSPQLVLYNVVRAAVSRDGTLAVLREEQAGVVSALALFIARPGVPEPWTPDIVEPAVKRYLPLGSLRFVEGALAFSPDGTRLGISAVGGSIDVPEDLMGWQFWVLPMPAGDPYRRLAWWSDVSPRVTSFAWLGDNTRIVLGAASLLEPGSHLWLADLERDRVSSLTRSGDSEYYPSSSPNGQQVVFTQGEPDYDLVEISVAGGTRRTLLGTARNEVDSAWSPDGNFLAYVTDRTGQDEIWLRARDGRSDQPVITQALFHDDTTIMLASPSFSPDGQRVAYLRNASKPIWPLRIWTSLIAGGTPAPLLPRSHEGYQSAPSWSPDGQWIAFSELKNGRWALAKARVGSGAGPEVLRTDGVSNAAPLWSPRDDWLTWETEKGFVLVSPDGKAERLLPGGPWLAHTWSRDGSTILGVREDEDADERRLSLVGINVNTGRTRVLADLGQSPPVNNPVRGLSVSLDGKTVVTSILKMRGDLCLLSGVHLASGSPRWPWPFRSR
jgi:Tol biopolymer transport system component